MTAQLTDAEENVLLRARVRELIAEKLEWQQRYNELLGNPTQDYTKGGSYDPNDGL